jgi:hypothetical protein
MSVNVENMKEIINNFAKKGVAYIVGLHPFLYSSYSKIPPYPGIRYDNVIKTLEPAFGRNNANMVYSDIEEVLEKLDMSAKIKIEDKEVSLREYLQKYILEEYISKIILEEVENRFKQMPEKDKIALSVACGIIDLVKSKDYPKLTINIKMKDFLEISLPGEENERYFSKVVSSLTGFEIPNIRFFFYKYLLGFQTDYPVYDSRYRIHHTEYVLNIFPFVKPYIEKLASEFTKYIKVLNKSDVKEKLYELYQKGEFLKLSVTEWALLKDMEESKLEFLSRFFGIPVEQLLEAVTVEGIIYRGFVNPLTYDYISETMEALYDEALKELMKPFRETFEKAGYLCACGRDSCTFTKPLVKPINIYFAAWPRDIPEKRGYESINVIIIQGLPSKSFLNYLDTRLEVYKATELWLFFDKEKGKLYVASNTYKEDLHKEFIETLEKRFTIEFSDQKLEVKEKGIEVIPLSGLPLMQRIKEVSSKDILESIVAVVLKDLGFSVRVDDKVSTKADTQVEVDVLGEKFVGDSKFIVYASCKNWGNVIESGVVREEIGRIEQMRLTPHVRVLVANLLSENAKKEAIANGFVIIEIGERVNENNAEKAYWKVYEKLNKLFAGVAPKWMQDLAEKAKKIAEEIKRIGEELEKAGGTYKF